jgi:hypothetical protein
MLIVCDKGKKSEGKREAKRQGILEKEEKVQEGKREMKKAA